MTLIIDQKKTMIRVMTLVIDQKKTMIRVMTLVIGSMGKDIKDPPALGVPTSHTLIKSTKCPTPDPVGASLRLEAPQV